jgi:parvulin-like peptidyl-prolyl isomerase
MSLKRLVAVCIAIGSMVLMVIGCGSSGTKTVADVGDYEITTQEFSDFFQSAAYPFASAQNEFDKSREVLDSMIVNRLLVQAAYEKNIDKLEELNRVVLANKDKFLLDVLYMKHIADKAVVTDAELKDFYDKLAYKVRASHILVKDLDTAQALLERIQAGENFEKLAYDYSIDPSAKRNKGDLGYFLWGALVDEFQQVAFAMEPGEVSPPVESSFGYHIIKLVDRLPNDQRGEFESMKSDLKRQISGKKRLKLMQDYFAGIAEKYTITIDTTTCSYLLRKREFLYPPQLMETLPKGDFDVDQLDRNERELVLATWDGGQITIIEYLQKAKQIPNELKPRFDNHDSLAITIFELKKLEILTYEALREGLDKDPEYVRKVRLFKELSMADIMRNDSLPKPLPPDDGMLRQYYDEHTNEYMNPAKVHVYEILLSDELKAKQLKKELFSLNVFKEKATDLTERPGKRALRGNLDYIERKFFPEIFDLARKTPVGKIGGPVVTMGKYSIFWVVDKVDEELKDYLDVKREIQSKLNSEQRNVAFQEWVKQRWADTDVDIYEDVLWSLVDMDKYSATDTAAGK